MFTFTISIIGKKIICDCIDITEDKLVEKNLSAILEICCMEFNTKIEDVKSDSRKQELIFTRKAFCKVIKEIFDLKNEIPAKIINKGHQDVSRYLKTQPENNYYNIVCDKIKARIKNELRIL